MIFYLDLFNFQLTVLFEISQEKKQMQQLGE